VPLRDLAEALPGGSALLRNEPVQARSTARLTGLLDAAAAVIAESGYERLTTAMVAERAGASIGTVYRYFPDRIAVLQSLSVRYLHQFTTTINATLANQRHKTWWDTVDAVITDLVSAFAHTPGFRSMRFGDVLDVRPVEKDRTGSSVVAELISSTLASRYGFTDNKELRFRLEVAITMADGLLARAYAFNPKGESKFVSETRAVVRAYLVGHYGDPKAG